MCPVCGSNRLREVWHNTDYYFIYDVDGDELTRVTEIADLCPGNGITVACCGCGEELHDGSIRGYLEKCK